MVRMVSSLLLVLLPVLYAYRESDSMLSALTRDSKGPESEGDDTDANAMDENKEKEESVEGPKETTKSGEKTSDSDDQGVLDCHSQLKMPINWKVTFKTIEEMQDKVEKLVRVTHENSDPQDTWGGLAQTEAENEGNIRLFLGAEVWFDGQKKDGKDCSITAEDLRLSSKIDCTEPGELIKTEESKTEDGHEVFRLKTSNSTLVLERQAAPDKDEPLVGDWTFESGDFKIVKKDSGLELEQKFWNKTIACSANLTKKDSDDKHYTANLVVKGSDCKNFKLRDCPTELCQADKNNSKCEAAKDLTFGFVKLELESDNNAIKRTVSASEAAPGKSFNVKRSFVAVDAEADAFVCVKVNETWEPIRGISYKQLANGGSQKQEIQKAEESKGTKIFEGKSIGKDWVQEDHVMEDSIFTKDEYLPPWKKSIQATVQWKKAVMCPEKFPLCYKDGDCVSEDCKNGCEWSRSPTVDAKTDMDYNYIAGADTLGTACDKSNEAMGKSKNAASGKSFLSLLLVAAFFRA